MKPKLHFYLILFCFSILKGQVNIVNNGGFETYSTCPTFGAQWNVCTGWNNVNLNLGAGAWGTPDYFNTCGSNNTAPPATFAGTCNPHTGNAMMALVLYHQSFANYREYLATPLSSTMQPGSTYTLSFWLSNGTGVISPWTISNIGVCFSNGPLSQTGYALITATPQCEITSNVVSSGWTNFTFTINPTTSYNYLTIGAFRTDANNNVTMSYSNPGGNPSAYANYFVDDIELWNQPCLNPPSLTITPSSTVKCFQNSTITLTAAGASSGYTWSPSSSLSSATGSLVTANPSVTTTYTLTGSNGTCTANSVITITVDPSFSITTVVSTASVCSGNAVTMLANGASTFTWQPGNITGTGITVNPTVTTVYTITGSNSFSCTSSSTRIITVLPNPSVAVNPGSSTVCAGTNFTFTQSGANSYSWSPIGLQTASSTIIFSLASSSQLTLTGTATNGCKSSIIVTASVSPNPSISIAPVSSSACSGSVLSYTANGANSYTWFPASITGSVYSFTVPASNTSYTLLGMSAFGCTTSLTQTLLVVASPTVSASTNPTSTCAGGSATLSAGGANSYTWFPGGLIGQAVVVNPLTTTIYTVSGEASACSSTASVIVANPLSPTISSTGNLNCNNTSSILYLAANSPTYSLMWSGPGIVGSLTSSLITVSSLGVYTCVITDTITNCSATETIAITTNIGPLPISIIPSSTLSCYPGPAVNLMISASANYSWFPAAEVSPANGPLVSVNPSVTTTYTVYATLGVCSGSSAITISVNPTPSVEPSVYSQTICSGITTTLFATGAANYQWNPGNINLPSPVVSPPSTTIYTVTGTSNSCSAVNTLTVVVLPSPFLFATIYPNTICIGNSATLNANGAESILWTSPNYTSNLSTVSVNPFASTVYTATGTNSLGCSSTATLALTVNSGPSLIPFVSDSLICSGETVTLSASGASSYTWFPGNQTGANIVVSPSVTTNYTVMSSALGCNSYTTSRVVILNCVKALFGVTNAADKPVFTKGMYYLIHFTVTAVNSSQQDLTNVKLTNSLPETFPQPSTFTVVNAPKVSSLGSQLKANPFYNGSSELSLTIADSSTLLASKRDTIVFSVLLDPRGISGSFKNWVIGFADLFSTQTLSDTSNTGFAWDPDQDGNPTNNNQATLLTIELIELFIPEGFSPNADGNNDLFEIKGLNGRKVNLTLFNRWGNKVYEQANYENNWGGEVNVNSVQFGNGKLPEGTYYYVLEFQDGKTEPINGFVVLRY